MVTVDAKGDLEFARVWLIAATHRLVASGFLTEAEADSLLELLETLDGMSMDELRQRIQSVVGGASSDK